MTKVASVLNYKKQLFSYFWNIPITKADASHQHLPAFEWKNKYSRSRGWGVTEQVHHSYATEGENHFKISSTQQNFPLGLPISSDSKYSYHYLEFPKWLYDSSFYMQETCLKKER